MQDLSYKEKDDKLKVRIRAHKKFANFDISDWIVRFLARKERRRIFDLGCGNGNHLQLYLKSVGTAGEVCGMDREQKLINEARETFSSVKNLDLYVGSMDDPLQFRDGSFDTCFSNFAIYNARDPGKTLRELSRILESKGQLVMIGPTMNNAKEIYEYNMRLTGIAIDPVTMIRTDRLRMEILPIAREVFNKVSEETINSFLTFPDRGEFLLYYRSTMLYEEGAAKCGFTEEQMEAACPGERDIILSKEMLAVIAEKE